MGQAVGAYGLTCLLARGLVAPSLLFILGGAAAYCALAVELVTALAVRSPQKGEAQAGPASEPHSGWPRRACAPLA